MLNLIEKFTPAVEADTNDAGLTTVEYAVAAAVVAAGAVAAFVAARRRPSTAAISDLVDRDRLIRLTRGEGFGPPPGTALMDSTPHSRNDSGLATVEFAIVGSLLLMLVFAVLTFGNILANKSAITSAVQDAARAASLPQGCSGSPCTPAQMQTIFTNHTGITTGVTFNTTTRVCSPTVSPAGTNAVMTSPIPCRLTSSASRSHRSTSRPRG